MGYKRYWLIFRTDLPEWMFFGSSPRYDWCLPGTHEATGLRAAVAQWPTLKRINQEAEEVAPDVPGGQWM